MPASSTDLSAQLHSITGSIAAINNKIVSANSEKTAQVLMKVTSVALVSFGVLGVALLSAATLSLPPIGISIICIGGVGAVVIGGGLVVYSVLTSLEIEKDILELKTSLKPLENIKTELENDLNIMIAEENQKKEEILKAELQQQAAGQAEKENIKVACNAAMVNKAEEINQVVSRHQNEVANINQNSSDTDRPSFFQEIKPFDMPLIDHNGIKALFAKTGHVGGGGQGAVYKARNLVNNQIRALKIALHHPDYFSPTALSIINALLDNGQTPHLTRIFSLQAITTFKNCLDVFSKSSDEFLTPPNQLPLEIPNGTLQTGCEMELLEGDMEKLWRSMSPIEENAFKIQWFATKVILERFNVEPSDEKLRNVFYKKLTRDDTFKGEVLMDYDYWKYTIEHLTIYIPRPSYLFKLGDYDDWKYLSGKSINPNNTFDPLRQLKSELTITGSLEEFVARNFPKPKNPNAKIMDMSPAKLTAEAFAL